MPRSTFSPVVVPLGRGITLAYDLVPSVDSCAIGFWINAGTRDEPGNQVGVAHLVEHTSFRRTPTRGNRKIASDFENVGAYANAYTTKEETCYYVRTLTDTITNVFPTLADVVLNPVFHPADIEKERNIIVEEIRSYEDEMEELAYDLAERQLFGKHPLGNPIVGTVSSVQNISAKQVRDFHRTHYHNKSVLITVSGNIQPEAFIEMASAVLPRRRSPLHPTKRTIPKPISPTEQRITRPTQQAHVVWHTRTAGLRHRSRAALALLNVVLGDGMTSRLHVRLREKSGLAYSITSQLQLFTDVGMFSVYAGTDVKKEGRVAQLIERELTAMMMHGITSSELRRAKQQLRSGRIMSLESLSSRMGLLGKGIFDDGKPENPYSTIDEIMAVTKEELDTVARVVCDPTQWHRLAIVPSQTV